MFAIVPALYKNALQLVQSTLSTAPIQVVDDLAFTLEVSVALKGGSATVSAEIGCIGHMSFSIHLMD